MSVRRQDLLFLGVGLVLCALTFGAQLEGAFVWDDVYIVRDNPSLRSLGGLAANFTQDTWRAADRPAGQFYRPLLIASFWPQARLGATTVLPHRLVSIALHLVCGLLLVRLLRRFAVSPAIALGLAWLFVIHPVVTEPVMWLAGRQEPLGVLFTLSALLLWPAPAAARPALGRALATISVLCAVLSKEGYLVAPLLLALTQYAWHRAELTARKAAWLLLPCGAIVVAFGLRAALGIGSGSEALGRSVLGHLQVGATLIAHYGALIAGLSNGLTFEPYVPLGGLASALVLVPLVLVGAGVLAIWLRDRSAPVALGGVWVGLVWFGVALMPLVMVVPSLGMHQNRYGYFPLVGVLVALACALELAAARARQALPSPRVAQVVLAAGAVGLLALTVARTRLEAGAWRDNLTLYGADVARAPTNGIALYHYGHASWEQGGCARAVPIYAAAAQHAPDYARAWNNLTGCLVELGRYTEALEPARRALALSPRSASAHYHRGVALLGAGQPEAGATELRRALQIDPQHRRTRQLLANMGQAPAAK